MRAIWNHTILAESKDTIEMEGRHYFPPASVRKEYLEPSETHTTSPGKGRASYYNIVVNDKINGDAAWYYPDPGDEAKAIRGMISFKQGIEITNDY